jgi:large subunit ribosomal protein L25
MPDAIPDDIEVDVSGMELGDSLHIRDLIVPAGVEFHTDDSLTVATVLVPRGLKEDEEQPEAEGEEGADAEAEGDDATDEKSEDEAK